MTSYNVAPYLQQAVRSVLDQTYPAAKVVVVDDGSTDEVEGALAPFVGAIDLIRQQNQGPAAAKNRAIRATDTDHVVLLDGDDWWEPGRLGALADLLVAYPDLGLATTDAYVCSDGVRAPETYYEGSGFWIDIRRPRESILRNNFVFSHSLLAREAWEAAGGFDPSFRNGSDRLCWTRMVLSGSRVGIIEEPLATYRRHRTGVSRNRLSAYQHRMRLFDQLMVRDDLSASERSIVIAQHDAAQTAFLMLRARQQLLAGQPDARRSSMDVARHRACGWGTRSRALAAAILPNAARKVALGRSKRAAC